MKQEFLRNICRATRRGVERGGQSSRGRRELEGVAPDGVICLGWSFSIAGAENRLLENLANIYINLCGDSIERKTSRETSYVYSLKRNLSI